MSGYRAPLKQIFGGEFDHASREERERAARDLIQACGAASGVVALQPVPLVDPLLITPIQIAMVQGIARIHGYRIDKKSALEFLRALRMSLLTQNVAIAAAKFVPALGWIVSAAIAHALTCAIRELFIHYFREGRSMLPAEMRAMLKRAYKENFERTYREKRAELKELLRCDARDKRRHT